MQFKTKLTGCLLALILSFGAAAAGAGETLGVSPFLDLRSNSNDTKEVTSAFDMSTPRSFTSVLLGLRFFYEPISRIMLNVDLFGGGTYFRTRTSTSGSTYETTLNGAAFGAAFTGGFSEKVLFSLGGGFSALSGKWRDVPQLKKPVTTMNPYVRAGIEYKAKNRFGVSLAVKYDLKTVEIKDREAVPNTLVEFSRLAIQPAMTIYF